MAASELRRQVIIPPVHLLTDEGTRFRNGIGAGGLGLGRVEVAHYLVNKLDQLCFLVHKKIQTQRFRLAHERTHRPIDCRIRQCVLDIFCSTRSLLRYILEGLRHAKGGGPASHGEHFRTKANPGSLPHHFKVVTAFSKHTWSRGGVEDRYCLSAESARWSSTAFSVYSYPTASWPRMFILERGKSVIL